MIAENFLKSDTQLSGLIDAFGRADPSVLTDVLAGTMGKVTVRTQLTPAFSFEPFARDPETGEPDPEASASAFNPLAWLKPEITIDTPAGPQQWAPYGTPDDYATVRLTGAAAFVGGAIGWALGIPYSKVALAGGALAMVGPSLLGGAVERVKGLLSGEDAP